MNFTVITRLQNKLHRNAGPEDLVATEAMLQRVSDDGSYNQDFVDEFRVFTAELRDFFNAGSFADMLEGLKGALDDQEHEVLCSMTLLALVSGNLTSWTSSLVLKCSHCKIIAR